MMVLSGKVTTPEIGIIITETMFYPNIRTDRDLKYAKLEVERLFTLVQSKGIT